MLEKILPMKLDLFIMIEKKKDQKGFMEMLQKKKLKVLRMKVLKHKLFLGLTTKKISFLQI